MVAIADAHTGLGQVQLEPADISIERPLISRRDIRSRLLCKIEKTKMTPAIPAMVLINSRVDRASR
jgi:hypothetical protein